jgi:hypothetical protein
MPYPSRPGANGSRLVGWTYFITVQGFLLSKKIALVILILKESCLFALFTFKALAFF